MLEYLISLKEFLATRPEIAFLALSLSTNAYLFRIYVKARDEHFATVITWLPVADRMMNLVSAAAEKARRRSLHAVPAESSKPEGE